MAIVVRLSSEWDPKGIEKAVKDINNAGKKLDSISANTKKSSDSFSSFGNGLKKLGLTIAATFGAREIGQFFSKSIKGAIEDEKSLRVLNKTLSNLGFAGATQKVDDFISRLQFSAGIADDELRPALNNLVLATGNLSKSQELLQVALDVSAGSGRDLDTITVALAKAFNGNFTALKKLNLGIDESLIKNKDLSGILTVLSQKFAGASANAVDTYAGKMQILKLAVSEAQETIGYAFLDALDNASGGTQNFAIEIQNLGQGTADIITGVASFLTQLQDLAVGLGIAKHETNKLGEEQADLLDKILLTIPVFGTYLKILKDKGEAERLGSVADAGSLRANSRLARQAKKTQDAINAQTQATENAKKAQEELKQNTTALTEVNTNYAKFVAGTSSQSIEGATTLATNALTSIQKLMSGQPKINKGLVTSFKDLASVVQANFTFALSQAQTKLEQATQKYNDFKDSIKSSITGVVSFTTIEEGSTFLDSLTKQSKQAEEFGGKIQKLLTLGLNQTAISNIAEAGFDVGTTIADEIIAGGSTIVQQVNTLTASVESVADSVSTSLADTFYSAGVNAAQNLVNAIIEQLNASAAAIAQAIANATQGSTTVVDTKPKPKPKPKPVPAPAPKPKPKPFDFGFRANGGPVSSGFPYIVGERGPELFMPNTSGKIVPNNQTKTGSVNNFNITVNAGIGTNPTQVGKEIVDAIKRFEKTSGPVFASA